jgi:hypothetical protein
MICKVLDDIFDKMYLYQIEGHVREIPLSSNNMANRKTWPFGMEGSHRLFGRKLFRRNGMNTVEEYDPKAEPFFKILDKIESELSVYFFLHEISLNVQHTGCHGTTHSDSGDPNDITLLMMTNAEWKKEWGGQFQLTSADGEDVFEEHEYVPGRIIVIPSNHPHRGLGPVEPYVYRSSIVWRVTPLDYYLRKNFQIRG